MKKLLSILMTWLLCSVAVGMNMTEWQRMMIANRAPLPNKETRSPEMVEALRRLTVPTGFDAENACMEKTLPPYMSDEAGEWETLFSAEEESISECRINLKNGVTNRFAVHAQFWDPIPRYWLGEGYSPRESVDYSMVEEFVFDVLGVDDTCSKLYGFSSPFESSKIKIVRNGEPEYSPYERFWFIFIDDLPGAGWNHPCRYVYLTEDLSAFTVVYRMTSPTIESLETGEPMYYDEYKAETAKADTIREIRESIATTLAVTDVLPISYSGNVSKSHFVIICGGQMPVKNNISHWADTATIYSTLTLKYKVPKSQIHVYMSDGTSSGKDANLNTEVNPVLVSSPLDLDGDGYSDVDGAATRTAVSSLFTSLRTKLSSDDQLVVFMTSHGGTVGNPGPNNYSSTFSLYSTSGTEKITDSELYNWTYRIACPIAFFINSCYSGGFCDNLKKTANRVVATSAPHDETCWFQVGSGTWGSGGVGQTNARSGWLSAIAVAFRGRKPIYNNAYPWQDGSVDDCSAEEINDGKVSVFEAFEYALVEDVFACDRDDHESCAGRMVNHPQLAAYSTDLPHYFYLLKPNAVSPLPGTPVISSVSGETAEGIEIKWNTVSNALQYDLYRSTTSVRPTSVYQKNVTSPYVDTEIDVDTTYYYWVSAVNSTGRSYSAYKTGKRVGVAELRFTDTFLSKDGTYLGRSRYFTTADTIHLGCVFGSFGDTAVDKPFVIRHEILDRNNNNAVIATWDYRETTTLEVYDKGGWGGDFVWDALNSLPGGNYTYQCTLDATNVIAELDESNNVATVSFSVEQTDSLAVSQTSIVVPSAGKTDSVKLTANCTWTASTSVSWLTVSPVRGSGNKTLSYTVSENVTNASRTGTITITGAGGGVCRISVTQEAAGVKPDLWVAPLQKWGHKYGLFTTTSADDDPPDMVRLFEIGDSFDAVFAIGNSGEGIADGTITSRLRIFSEATKSVIWEKEITGAIHISTGRGLMKRIYCEDEWRELPAGVYRMYVELDTTDAIDEVKEDNNSFDVAFAIYDPIPLEEALNCSTLTFTNNGGWYGTRNDGPDGGCVARTHHLGNSSTNSLTTTVTGPGTLSFDWKVSSEKNYDKLSLVVDGETVKEISGIDVDWSEVTYEIGSGSHTIEWRYTKDSSYYNGYDCGWLSNISWQLAKALVTFNANGGSLTGPLTRTLVQGSAIGSLPVPTRSGYAFLGWFTSVAGGTQVSETTTVSRDMILYAQWEKQAPDLTFYRPTGWSRGVFLSDQSEKFTPVSSFEYGTTIYLNCAFGNVGTADLEDDFVIRHELINTATDEVVSVWNYSETNTIEIDTARLWKNTTGWAALQNLYPGAYMYRCTLDSNNNVDEVDETNNVREFTFTVEAAAPTFTIDENGVLTAVELNGQVHVTIPDSVTRITKAAFAACETLESVTISAGVKVIDMEAFRDCTELKAYYVDEANTEYKAVNGALLSKNGEKFIAAPTGATSVTIPDGVIVIARYAFFCCLNLTTVVIPEGVKEIGFEAFISCSSLTTVDIPESMAIISERAFMASGLRTVTIPENVIILGNSSFALCAKMKDASVPFALKSQVEEGGVFYLCASDFVINYYPTASSDPIPELDDDATSADVATALKDAKDAKLLKHIVTSDEYAAFRDWAKSLPTATPQEVKDANHAWLSYALDVDSLIATPPRQGDMTIAAFDGKPSADELAFTVDIKNLTVGDGATAENLKKVFAIEGCTTLGVNNFSADTVSLKVVAVENGKVKFTIAPKSTSAKTFFFRVKMNDVD